MTGGPPAASTLSPLAVCPGCGLIAPAQRTSCVVCATAFGPAPLLAAGSVGATVWSCILEADVVCRVCNLRTPIRGLSLAGELTCERCGQLQAFAPQQWDEGLHHAHAVAATCAPRMQGGPAARIGVDATTIQRAQSTTIISGGTTTTLTLRVKASCGNPLCPTCRAPLGAEIDTAGRLTVVCHACGTREAYALPPGAREIYAPLLRGVYASEQRDGQPRAVVNREAGGLVALKCPTCGAALSIAPGTEMITCGHCRTSSLVPRVALARPGEAPTFTPFWVLFDAHYALEAADDEEQEDDEEEEDEAPRAAPSPVRTGSWMGIAIAVAGVVIAIVVAITAMTQGDGGKRRHRRHGSIAPTEAAHPSG